MRSVLASEVPDRAATALVAVAVAILGILVYANTVGNEFVWDDVSSILIHEHVQDPAKIGQLFLEDQHAFGRGQGNFYRPLLSVTFMIDYWLTTGGEEPARVGGAPDISPFLFHVSSMLWHLCAALALLAVLARARAPLFVQAATAFVYVVHPLHTEAVAYISGRADSMAATFVFLGLFFALSGSSPLRIILASLACLLCFAGAVLSKESGAMLPVLALLAALCRIRTAEERPGKRTKAFYFMPALASGLGLALYGVLRSTVLSFAESQANESAPFLQRAIEAGQAFALYLKLLLWPTHLHMERSLDGVPGWFAILGALGLVACIAICILGFWSRRIGPALGMGLFLVTWFPISGLIPLNAPMAEHWLYVPMAGFWWALFDILFSLLQPRKAISYAAAGILVFLLILLGLTVDRNRDWHDNITLFEATLAENPDTLRVRYNLAVAYELEENWPAARREYEKVLDMYQRQRDTLVDDSIFWPQELEAHISLGDIALRDGRIDDAYNHFTEVLRRARSQAYVQYAIRAALGAGRCLVAAGDWEQARNQLAPLAQRFPGIQEEVDAILGEGPTPAPAQPVTPEALREPEGDAPVGPN